MQVCSVALRRHPHECFLVVWGRGTRKRLPLSLRLEILKRELGHITPSTLLGPTGIRKSSQNACALMLILKAT